MSQSQFLPPSPADPHHLFWAHLRNGGRVWRNDPLNNIAEWIDLATLQGASKNLGMPTLVKITFS